MNTRLLTLFFVFCTYFQITAALPFYELSAENFQNDFNAIDEEHLETFTEGHNGIGLVSVRNYLEGLAGIDPSGSYLSAPTMCITAEFKNTLSIEVEGDFETFHFSYFKAQDGTYQSRQISSNNFEVPLEHGWQRNILTIYGSSRDNRSNLYIIIIDKDLFRCDDTCNGTRGSSLIQIDGFTYPGERITKTAIKQFSSFPNPTSNKTTLSFQLNKAQKVALEIIHPSTGRVIARKLEDQYLLEGQYEYDFDLQTIPAGVYLFVLKTAYNVQSIPIVKIE